MTKRTMFSTYDDWKLATPEEDQNNIWTKCPLCKQRHWSHAKCNETEREYEYEDRLEDPSNDLYDC